MDFLNYLIDFSFLDTNFYLKNFQFPATSLMYGLVTLHNHIMFILIFIVFFVFNLIIEINYYFTLQKKFLFFDINIKKALKIYNINFRHDALLEII